MKMGLIMILERQGVIRALPIEHLDVFSFGKGTASGARGILVIADTAIRRSVGQMLPKMFHSLYICVDVDKTSYEFAVHRI